MKVFAIISDALVITSLIITMVLLSDALTSLFEVSMAIILVLLLFFTVSSVFITIHAFKRKD